MAKNILLDQHNACYDDNQWFVSLKTVLDGVTAEDADWRPDGADNTIRETRQGDARAQQHGIILAAGVSAVRMKGNRISGHPGQAILDESGAADHVLQTV